MRYLILLLLLLPSPADAQGSWVLWERKSIIDAEGNVAGFSEWEIKGSFPEYDQCFRRRMTHFSRVMKPYMSHRIQSIKNGWVAIEERPDETFDIMRYVYQILCLQDHLSPPMPIMPGKEDAPQMAPRSDL